MLDNQTFQKSSETSPSNNKHSEESGRVYTDPAKALADFDAEVKPHPQESIEADPRISQYLVNAHLLMKHREFALALNLLRQASNLDSKNPRTLRMLAECLEKTHRLEEALIAHRVLAEMQDNFTNLYGYATTLYKLGQDQMALDKYFEALAVLHVEDERLFEIYKNMGNIYVRQGDFDGAEEYYNKAYTMNPQSDILLVNLGTLEVQRQDYDKSLFCFRQAVECNSENEKAWVGLAMVHNHFGDIDLAWANVETAMDINPKNRTAVHLAANWGVRDNRIPKAIEALQNYLGVVEQDEDMSLVLINLFCSCGQFANALLEIERVLLWNPDHGEVMDLKKKLTRAQGQVA